MRKAGQISQTTIEILILIGIVVVINIFGQYYYARADLTEDKQYSLAQSSKEIVSDLPDRVHITAYISGELPPELQPYEQRLRDLLDEYRASASALLTIQFINPDNLDDEEQGNLEMRGIAQQPVQITGSDQLSYRNVYMGLEIVYLEEYKVIPFVVAVQNLEYEITSSILKLVTEETPTIGFLTGHGEKTTQMGYSALAESLRELYNVRDTDLGNGRKIGDNVNTLIIAQPTEPFTERHRYCIDQFLMRGGKLVVLGSGVKMDEMQNQAQFQAFPLDSLISSYGVKIRNDLVADLGYSWQVPVSMGGGFRIMTNYPLFPKISAPDGFPSDSPATRDLQVLVLPYVSSLELLYDRIADETEIVQLAKSTQASYSYPVPVDLSPPPQQDFRPPGGESDLSQQLVAVELRGVFTSAFQGQAKPAFDLDPDAAEGTLPEMDDEPMLTTSPETSLVVIGNAMFIEDAALSRLPGNEVFFQNLVESLNLGEKLIGIRSRTVTHRPLNPDLTDAEKNGLRFWGYGAVPLIVTIFGVARFYLKGQRKRLLQALLAAEQQSAKKG